MKYEHDGCVGCKYEACEENYIHCTNCICNSTDKYIPSDNYLRVKQLEEEIENLKRKTETPKAINNICKGDFVRVKRSNRLPIQFGDIARVDDICDSKGILPYKLIGIGWNGKYTVSYYNIEEIEKVDFDINYFSAGHSAIEVNKDNISDCIKLLSYFGLGWKNIKADFNPFIDKYTLSQYNPFISKDYMAGVENIYLFIVPLSNEITFTKYKNDLGTRQLFKW